MEGGSMDKINASNQHSRPIWERSKSKGGHHSAVDAALQAHRERAASREIRTAARLDSARGVENSMAMPMTAMGGLSQENRVPMDVLAVSQPGGVGQIEAEIVAESLPTQPQYIPRQIDEMYGEAQLGSLGERALGLISKELSAPEDFMSDEIPKGSYVDYVV
jgi:hypothetical protein